ncbi:asparaginase [Actinokineospora sp. PR83]|uniref:asparaginase n=1 Tax=Actinokineospora sp. PR83 TaxID=2884908 RepID=UPI001F2F3C7A|nr:asparaginase [Actinokineospora sp. PR83]MCG8920279.1 asparaginase [Actinokineospora sp. PR83]
MSRIVVLGMGGTIAMAPSASGGVVPALDAAALIAAVPELAAHDITARTLRSLPSPSVGFADLAALAAAVRAEVDGGADGVVVTHGTDTLEESAFHLDATLDPGVPVVVTGAMRHPTAPGADGPANLLAAVTVAASPAARGLGVLVVLSDEVHGARFVRKTHTSSTAAFASPGTGPYGTLVEGEPRLRRVDPVSPRLPVPTTATPPRVGLVAVSLGDDGELLRHAAPALDGVVLAGLGAGHVPEVMVPAVAEVAARVPVVLTSRTGGGSVLRTTYGYPGSERDLLARGLVHGGFLDPAKARVLLHLLLADGADRARVDATFAAYR